MTVTEQLELLRKRMADDAWPGDTRQNIALFDQELAWLREQYRVFCLRVSAGPEARATIGELTRGSSQESEVFRLIWKLSNKFWGFR